MSTLPRRLPLRRHTDPTRVSYQPGRFMTAVVRNVEGQQSRLPVSHPPHGAQGHRAGFRSASDPHLRHGRHSGLRQLFAAPLAPPRAAAESASVSLPSRPRSGHLAWITQRPGHSRPPPTTTGLAPAAATPSAASSGRPTPVPAAGHVSTSRALPVSVVGS